MTLKLKPEIKGQAGWYHTTDEPIPMTLKLKPVRALLVAALLLFAPAAMAENWGRETSAAIEGGFDQGGHASDQSNPRQGLGNVNKAAEAVCGPTQGLGNLLEFLLGQC